MIIIITKEWIKNIVTRLANIHNIKSLKIKKNIFGKNDH